MIGDEKKVEDLSRAVNELKSKAEQLAIWLNESELFKQRATSIPHAWLRNTLTAENGILKYRNLFLDDAEDLADWAAQLEWLVKQEDAERTIFDQVLAHTEKKFEHVNQKYTNVLIVRNALTKYESLEQSGLRPTVMGAGDRLVKLLNIREILDGVWPEPDSETEDSEEDEDTDEDGSDESYGSAELEQIADAIASQLTSDLNNTDEGYGSCSQAEKEVLESNDVSHHSTPDSNITVANNQNGNQNNSQVVVNNGNVPNDASNNDNQDTDIWMDNATTLTPTYSAVRLHCDRPNDIWMEIADTFTPSSPVRRRRRYGTALQPPASRLGPELALSSSNMPAGFTAPNALYASPFTRAPPAESLPMPPARMLSRVNDFQKKQKAAEESSAKARRERDTLKEVFHEPQTEKAAPVDVDYDADEEESEADEDESKTTTTTKNKKNLVLSWPPPKLPMPVVQQDGVLFPAAMYPPRPTYRLPCPTPDTLNSRSVINSGNGKYHDDEDVDMAYEADNDRSQTHNGESANSWHNSTIMTQRPNSASPSAVIRKPIGYALPGAMEPDIKRFLAAKNNNTIDAQSSSTDRGTKRSASEMDSESETETELRQGANLAERRGVKLMRLDRGWLSWNT